MREINLILSTFESHSFADISEILFSQLKILQNEFLELCLLPTNLLKIRICVVLLIDSISSNRLLISEVELPKPCQIVNGEHNITLELTQCEESFSALLFTLTDKSYNVTFICNGNSFYFSFCQQAQKNHSIMRISREMEYIKRL